LPCGMYYNPSPIVQPAWNSWPLQEKKWLVRGDERFHSAEIFQTSTGMLVNGIGK
jgi:hypothetical protein